jgi:hypothetical protein
LILSVDWKSFLFKLRIKFWKTYYLLLYLAQKSGNNSGLTQAGMITGRQLNQIGLGYVRYNNLHQFNRIEELINEERPGIAILIEQIPNVGHWILMLKSSPNEIEFFDSYGFAPDDQLIYAPFSAGHDYVTDMLNKWIDDGKSKKRKVAYLGTSIQSRHHSVVTCGRYVALRFLARKFSLRQFLDKAGFKTPDESNMDSSSFNDRKIMTLTKSIFPTEGSS